MLLARPWIHANLVVTSSYHISIKFPMNGTIITVVGELDVEEECIMFYSQDWFTSDLPTLIATPSTQASFKFSPFFSILY
jgi:hypothetical protein